MSIFRAQSSAFAEGASAANPLSVGSGSALH